EPRDLHSDQFKATLVTILRDMKDDLQGVLTPAGASTTSGALGQDGSYQDWETLHRIAEDIQGASGRQEAKVDALEANSGRQEAKMDALEATMSEMATALAARMSEMAADVMTADDGVVERLDVLLTMLMAVRGEKVDIPCQACVLPGDYGEPDVLSDELRKPEVWTKKLEDWIERDFKAGKGFLKKKKRLFLVCAHTHQLVPCGHNGRGY
ncbi:unnamed protein product, partial [Laminaria digitata]